MSTLLHPNNDFYVKHIYDASQLKVHYKTISNRLPKTPRRVTANYRAKLPPHTTANEACNQIHDPAGNERADAPCHSLPS